MLSSCKTVRVNYRVVTCLVRITCSLLSLYSCSHLLPRTRGFLHSSAPASRDSFALHATLSARAIEHAKVSDSSANVLGLA
jgi:hypothetical protein